MLAMLACLAGFALGMAAGADRGRALQRVEDAETALITSCEQHTERVAVRNTYGQLVCVLQAESDTYVKWAYPHPTPVSKDPDSLFFRDGIDTGLGIGRSGATK